MRNKPATTHFTAAFYPLQCSIVAHSRQITPITLLPASMHPLLSLYHDTRV
ncbi:hypothetical protein [Chitinophaga nivalis]|uniref:Uncharacterized protein n=1 Tax=Chitinophaga nivalis TaxID=2991709 RepID=A0ABT3IK00_9BACT|nr:hypothetical protein [Chitinophaga nivalis]MCW3466058.1 hypothetical protein [Chitinophaga nivalis]MCW3484251.1 hypothetical protein [Chitinophaga nivalis]